jgi:hypothetical protein
VQREVHHLVRAKRLGDAELVEDLAGLRRLTALGEDHGQHRGERSARHRKLLREIERVAQVLLRRGEVAALESDPSAHREHQGMAVDKALGSRLCHHAFDHGFRALEPSGPDEVGDDQK